MNHTNRRKHSKPRVVSLAPTSLPLLAFQIPVCLSWQSQSPKLIAATHLRSFIRACSQGAPSHHKSAWINQWKSHVECDPFSTSTDNNHRYIGHSNYSTTNYEKAVRQWSLKRLTSKAPRHNIELSLFIKIYSHSILRILHPLKAFPLLRLP